MITFELITGHRTQELFVSPTTVPREIWLRSSALRIAFWCKRKIPGPNLSFRTLLTDVLLFVYFSTKEQATRTRRTETQKMTNLPILQSSVSGTSSAWANIVTCSPEQSQHLRDQTANEIVGSKITCKCKQKVCSGWTLGIHSNTHR
jgi:hypothetical protein